jgi:hypothetical protein
MSTPQFGVYRAAIVELEDPMHKGRIRVSPPTPLGDVMAVWAPALITESLANVHVGDIVLVAFENGNTLYPVVLGVIERSNGS